MHFFKSTLFLVFAGCCISSTLAQLDLYDQLSVDEFKEKCKNNGVDLSELAAIHAELDALREENTKEISSEEALKENCQCIGPKLKGYLEKEMSLVKKCIAGEISLSDSDTETLIKRSTKKMCALVRLSSFEKTIASCTEADKQLECETEVLAPVTALDNTDEFANIGLTYSKKGKKVWDQLYDCTTKAIESCSEEQKKTHLILTIRMKTSMIERS